MKIFPTESIRQLDAHTIESESIASIDLMERAARALAENITERWDTDTPFTFFAGPGNNGGDALALARLMAAEGYDAEVYLFNPQGTLSPDCQANRDRLAEGVAGVRFHEITTQFTPPVLTADHVVVDGLFGSGLNKPLAGGFAAVVKYINASPATVVSIDIPSGLMGEDNTYNHSAGIVHAHYTLSLQLPKLAFLFAENEPYVGEWDLIDISLSREAIDDTDTDFQLLEHDDMAALLRPRRRFAHKGDFGRALLVAGSQGMAGASVLAARACLRSGVGRLTVHLPFCNNFIVQTAVPEAVTQLDASDLRFTTAPDTDDYQAVAVGPGLGCDTQTEDALLSLLDACQTPLVLDADALNLLGDNRSYLGRLPRGSVLTPHPKELERLVGRCRNSYERLVKARELAQDTGLHIILKGAFTAIITPTGRCFFNPTGNPGMATAGSGDVLTGILLALMVQGYDTCQAACLATYIHGLAGDVACRKQGDIAMTAGDIASCLPVAWKMLASLGE